MSGSTLINGLFIFMLAGFIGFEVIRRVSPLLHTPLMSPGSTRARSRQFSEPSPWLLQPATSWADFLSPTAC
jgi:hypothetical protein